MTWEEKVPGKWSSDQGYAIRQRDDGWVAFTPDGVPVDVPVATFDEAAYEADQHHEGMLG